MEEIALIDGSRLIKGDSAAGLAEIGPGFDTSA